MKYAILALLCLCMAACSSASINNDDNNDAKRKAQAKASTPAAEAPVRIEETDSLLIYFPKYSRIDLVCGNRPEPADSAVIMMVAGAFTGELLDTFKHSNIAGNHVSNGTFHKGYTCRRNNGAFLFYNGKPRFLHGDYEKAMQDAAENGGCAVGQEMMIHRGNVVKHTRKNGNVNIFRALCLIDGKVAVADSRKSMRFDNFIKALQDAGATEALYLDMGTGWNYSWYRDRRGRAVEIFPVATPYSTNWITFYSN